MKIETEENCRAEGHQEYQEEIVLNGEKVWVDPELIPLLKELNNVGLITRSHCSGHETDEAFVVIKSDNITDLQIRRNNPYDEIVISWKRAKYKVGSKVWFMAIQVGHFGFAEDFGLLKETVITGLDKGRYSVECEPKHITYSGERIFPHTPEGKELAEKRIGEMNNGSN